MPTKTKAKERTVEVVEEELQEAAARERQLVEELRAIPEQLATAEHEDRVEDSLALRRRGEELPLHLHAAAKSRLHLVIEKAELELPGFDKEIRDLGEEAAKQKEIADRARDAAAVLTGQWEDARRDRNKAQRSLTERRRRLAALEASGPDYRALEKLTSSAREPEPRRYPARMTGLNG